jgi:hypothetical protein
MPAATQDRPRDVKDQSKAAPPPDLRPGDIVFYWRAAGDGPPAAVPAMLVQPSRTVPGAWDLSLFAPGVVTPKRMARYSPTQQTGCWSPRGPAGA